MEHSQRLLHSSPTGASQSDGDSQTVCERFALFLRWTVINIKESIKAKLIGRIYDPLTFDRRYSGVPLADILLVDNDKVRHLLASMPAKSSPMDKVPTSILKSCNAIFVPIIARLANLSFAEGVVPSSFKLMCISPLLRSQLQQTKTRPISNLNTISKVLSLFLAQMSHTSVRQ